MSCCLAACVEVAAVPSLLSSLCSICEAVADAAVAAAVADAAVAAAVADSVAACTCQKQRLLSVLQQQDIEQGVLVCAAWHACRGQLNKSTSNELYSVDHPAMSCTCLCAAI